MLKKYSPIGELGEFAASYAESLSHTTGHLICITDRDYVIAAAGTKKRDYEGKPLSSELENLIEQRGNVRPRMVHILRSHWMTKVNFHMKQSQRSYAMETVLEQLSFMAETKKSFMGK